jgi:hypothetical protein
MQILVKNEKNLIVKYSNGNNNSNSNSSVSVLKMEAACFSEKVLAINQATHCHDLEHNNTYMNAVYIFSYITLIQILPFTSRSPKCYLSFKY